MLAPSLEDHQRLETVGQGLLQFCKDHLLVWGDVRPLKVQLRCTQLPHLGLFRYEVSIIIILLLIIVLFFLFIIFTFLALLLLRLQLVVHSGVKLPILALAMWGQQEWLRPLLQDRATGAVRIEHHVDFEHWLASTILEQVLLRLDLQLGLI